MKHAGTLIRNGITNSDGGMMIHSLFARLVVRKCTHFDQTNNPTISVEEGYGKVSGITGELLGFVLELIQRPNQAYERI